MADVLTPDNAALWIVSFRRLAALRETVRSWLTSFPFDRVNVIVNDPTVDHASIIDEFPQVVIWRNIFRDTWETGSIAWCWNQCMRHTFLERDWCLMSQDDVLVTPGWNELITDDHWTYVAPVGDTVQLQSRAGFNAVGWFDERFRAIGGPEADYLLRMMQTYPDRLSVHDEHVWQYRHHDVGLAHYWKSAPLVGEVAATRFAHNVRFANEECFARWDRKWGEHVDTLMSRPSDAERQLGWEELDWYPSFTRRMRELGRAE
jgi:hypothetical protein